MFDGSYVIIRHTVNLNCLNKWWKKDESHAMSCWVLNVLCVEEFLAFLCMKIRNIKQMSLSSSSIFQISISMKRIENRQNVWRWCFSFSAKTTLSSFGASFEFWLPVKSLYFPYFSVPTFHLDPLEFHMWVTEVQTKQCWNVEHFLYNIYNSHLLFSLIKVANECVINYYLHFLWQFGRMIPRRMGSEQRAVSSMAYDQV